MTKYDPAKIEFKWQEIWEKNKAFEAKDDTTKPKFYALIEFPYPSGDGLHVGHPRSNTAMDIISRKRRMEGYNVLFPIGWDAFGLPTENFAIKNKVHPAVVTERNVNRFREQLKRLGFSFDWSREVNTTDPAYYKWTQWIFLKLYEHGLAYKAEVPINFCVSCKVGLANEEVVGGKCERCDGEVVRRVKSQWMLKITEYAEKLLEGLEEVDYIEKVKTQQRNWIGKSKGAEVDFAIPCINEKLTVFTTRPDTLFGATYMVISPEHPILDRMKEHITNFDEVEAYRAEAIKKSDFERSELNKEKTGVSLKGVVAINPVNNTEIPVWISDYVLMSYGTGAIMAVPAHDERDYEFAKKFDLPIIEVVAGGDIENEAFTDIETGTMVNSDFLNGMSVAEAKEAITKWLAEKRLGKEKINYKLRDWVFSRQRYWGEPIPIIHCEKCGYVPVPYDQLPVTLPDIENYQQSDSGESPLVNIPEWVNTTCPKCNGPAKRETDTMPQWAGSSWYFIRYADPHNDDAMIDKKKAAYWLPVDWYNGGMEHTTLHLLYSRFWHRFLYDIGEIPCKEPYKKRTSHGMILGTDGQKMSKSRGNVINPDDVVDEFGADTFRLYEMFMGAFDQTTPWSEQGVRGCYRFIDRVWKLQELVTDEEEVSEDHRYLVHTTIKKVSEDYESMKYNTAIAQMMTFVNEVNEKGKLSRGDLRVFVKLLNPVAPHIAEEIWEKMNLGEGYLYEQSWPEYDAKYTVKDEIEIAVQINGKVRERLDVPSKYDKKQIEEFVLANEKVQDLIGDKQIRKIIVVPGRLVNIVVG